jgi:competence protein ComEA
VPSLPRSHLVAYVVAGAAVVLLGARWARSVDGGAASGRPPPGATAPVRVEHPAGGPAVVHVAGEVRRPGVYRLRAGARVEHAVARAGGPTRRANLDALNLAAKVDDGRQVVVPARAPPAASASAVAGTAGGSAPAGPVNLNSATAEELGTLDGVGPATAEKIIAYRTEHGGFSAVDELDQVPGIGAKRLEALRPLVTV